MSPRHRPREFVGYIGPNGAGKSTTVKMLTGILHPTSGNVLVGGLSPQRDRQTLAKEIGVVFGQRTQLWWDLPTVDSFEILAAMYDVGKPDYQNFLKEFDDLLGIGEFLDTPVRRLSLGQRMRAELAASLVHRPKILFLDEPTIGLDVVAKGKMRGVSRVYEPRTRRHHPPHDHDLRDIEELCERVIMINHGRVLYDGNLDTLRDRAGLPTVMSVKYAQMPAGLAEGKFIGTGGKRRMSRTTACGKVDAVNYESRTVQVRF
jgi:ABC-2 type transport system ATP-binding protein